MLSLLLTTLTAFAATPADLICTQLAQTAPTLTQAQYEQAFAPNFVKAVSLATLQDTFKEVVRQAGACTSTSSSAEELTLHTATKFDVVFGAHSDGTRYTGLMLNYIDDTSVHIKKWSDLADALEAINSQASVGLTLKSQRVHLAHNEDLAYAIGSTFKLYVLGALEKQIREGGRKWTEPLVIRNDWKSLGSGNMNELPAGTSATLAQFASKMISISDNTAADHLLYTLGRENVEAMLAPMGNTRASLNIPFLATNEIFKLKWIVPSPLDYVRSDVSGKRALLSSLAAVPLGPLREVDSPADIWTIEWFGSTNDTCNAILYLADRGPEVRSILSKNVPFASSHWTYAGYKGGSEPGVLSMTYLLETAHSRACLSVSYNNMHKRVDELRVEGLVRKALLFAEKIISF